MDTTASKTQNNLLQYHHCDYASVTRIIVHKEYDCSDIKSSALIRVQGTPNLLSLLLGTKQNHLSNDGSTPKTFEINNTLIFANQKPP